MYIIVKDTNVGGVNVKRSIVLNRSSYSEVFRSKNCAKRVLKEIVEDTEEKYEVINDEKYGGNAYSFWNGSEIFYVYSLYIDNSL